MRSNKQTCGNCKWSRTFHLTVASDKPTQDARLCFAQKNAPMVNPGDSCADWKPKVDPVSPRTATYNGYTLMLYGKSSMSVCDPDGKEVFHTGSRNQSSYTHDEMVQIIKTVLELLNKYKDDDE